MPLEHLAGYADAVRVMEPIHGLVFLGFFWIASQTVTGDGGSVAEAIRLFVARSCRSKGSSTCRSWPSRALRCNDSSRTPICGWRLAGERTRCAGGGSRQRRQTPVDRARVEFRAAAETMMTIAADPKHLGARIGITAVLYTWGSAMTHPPHIHMIVPGGGLSAEGTRWISSRPAFLLPVRVLGKLFRRLFLTRLIALHDAGRLAFFGSMAPLADRRALLRYLSPVRAKRWVVYAKGETDPRVHSLQETVLRSTKSSDPRIG